VSQRNKGELEMKLNELIKKVTESEGKKVETSIGNVREVLRVLATILANDEEAAEVFMKYVKRKVKK